MTVVTVIFLISTSLFGILSVLMIKYSEKQDRVLTIMQETNQMYIRLIIELIKEQCKNLTDEKRQKLLKFIVEKEQLLIQFGKKSDKEEIEKLKKFLNSDNLNSSGLNKSINIKA